MASSKQLNRCSDFRIEIALLCCVAIGFHEKTAVIQDYIRTNDINQS
ncbi:MAG: hypothetical protein LH628_14080 [Microcoleus sp. CAN_BIN18]|nr:hypothetical protein [Microcoleus sp. CAN_BIN18]